MADKVSILVLCGPTATGKTALAAALARRLGGEVVGADSMQVYRGLPIGTAAPTAGEMDGVPHHLIGFLDPAQPFSVADYVRLASACVADICARGRVPIVAGGTGLYLSSLVEGLRFAGEKAAPGLREELQQRLAREGIAPLYAELQQIDPAYAATLHPNNHGRVLRALELYRQTGRTMSWQLAHSRPAEHPYHALLYGLDFPQRSQLYARINARVDAMMDAGLLEEARGVYAHRGAYRTAAQAIGYKEFFPYFEGAVPLESCIEQLKQATRRYAKRQLTWFRRMAGLRWEQAADPTAAERIAAAWREWHA